jgi:hypothetical protein
MVYRAKFHNEFLEEKLQESLDPIFKFPGSMPNEFYMDIKHLLFQVSGINKSANFGYFFYEQMQDNPYPFCEDVLKTATFTEQYYNLHDKVLKSYVRSFLINNQVEPKIILEYDTIIPEGHGLHFFEEMKLIERFGLKEPLPISADLFTTLFHIIDNDAFPMTQKKVASIISYLNIDKLLPVLSGKISSLMRRSVFDLEKAMVLLHFLKAIQIIRSEIFYPELNDALAHVINSPDNNHLYDNYTTFKHRYGEIILQLLYSI